jgi:DNA-binding response OmpR family regulator
VARAAGLGLEKYAAAAAAETLARLAQDDGSSETLGTVARAAKATLTDAAIAAAERLLADLGLSPSCAYRLIAADGGVSYAAKMDASRLGLERKDLVVDGNGETVLRRGRRVADLRRRTLLKRLLFLFAGAPGRLFTKEEIVEKIWGVEYHPLHHDAALFTNVMRLRRLLGPGGPDLLRVGDGGYLLAPPPDFLFIERLPV